MSATVFGTLGWSVGPPQSSFSFLPLLTPAVAPAGPLGSNGTAIAGLTRGLATLTHPLELMTANAAMAGTGVLAIGAGFSIGIGACGGDGPFAVLTCVPGVILGGSVVGAGAFDIGLSYYFFTHATLPALRGWGGQ